MRPASGISQQGKDQCVIGERSAQETIFPQQKRARNFLLYDFFLPGGKHFEVLLRALSCLCIQILLGGNWPPYSLPAITNSGQENHYIRLHEVCKVVLSVASKLRPPHGLRQH